METFTSIEAPARSNFACPAARLLLKANAPREAWLAARKKGIGGSEASKILGLSTYGDQFSVWAEKTDRAPEVEDNEAMYWGRALEPLLRQRFTEDTGLKVRASGLLQSREYPHILYTPDGLTSDGGILECKTFGQFIEKEWVNADGSEAVPDHAYAQVQQGLLVTGRSHAWIVGLGSGRNWYKRRVERDEALMALIIQQAALVWDHVLNDTEPPVGQYAAEVLDHLHPVGEGELALDSTADGDKVATARALRAAYMLAAEAEKKAKDDKATARAKILQFLGDHESLTADGDKLLNMKNTGQFVKSEWLKNAEPEQVEAVTAHTVQVPLRDPKHGPELVALVEAAYDRLLETLADETGARPTAPVPELVQELDADKVKALYPAEYTAARARRLLISK